MNDGLHFTRGFNAGAPDDGGMGMEGAFAWSGAEPRPAPPFEAPRAASGGATRDAARDFVGALESVRDLMAARILAIAEAIARPQGAMRPPLRRYESPQPGAATRAAPGSPSATSPDGRGNQGGGASMTDFQRGTLDARNRRIDMQETDSRARALSEIRADLNRRIEAETDPALRERLVRRRERVDDALLDLYGLGEGEPPPEGAPATP